MKSKIFILIALSLITTYHDAYPAEEYCGVEKINLTTGQYPYDNEYLYETNEVYKLVQSKGAKNRTQEGLPGKVWECDTNSGCPGYTLIADPTGEMTLKEETSGTHTLYRCKVSGDDKWVKIEVEQCADTKGLPLATVRNPQAQFSYYVLKAEVDSYCYSGKTADEKNLETLRDKIKAKIKETCQCLHKLNPDTPPAKCNDYIETGGGSTPAASAKHEIPKPTNSLGTPAGPHM